VAKYYGIQRSWGAPMKPYLAIPVVLFLAISCAGCAIQRAAVANDAQEKMLGLSKEQILACMGPPAAKAKEGRTEVWSYNSGNGYVSGSTFGTSTAALSGGPGYATGSVVGSGFGVSERRFCTVNVTMVDGRVGRINYLGPTGGLLTAGEQCAFAVEHCAR
jgi:hypothetical protein